MLLKLVILSGGFICFRFLVNCEQIEYESITVMSICKTAGIIDYFVGIRYKKTSLYADKFLLRF